MSASLPPLPRTIQFLRDVARARSDQWPVLVRDAEHLERVTIGDAGACAALLSAQVRPLVLQCVQVVPEGEEAMRRLLLSLADALQYEQNARGREPFYIEKG